MNKLIKKYIFRLLPPKYLIYLISYKNLFFGEKELRYLKHFVDPMRNAVDVGAHRGIYSFFLSKIVRKVYLFEPNPDLADFLRKVNNSNFKILEVALSKEVKKGTLRIPISNNELLDSWGSISEKIKKAQGSYQEVLIDIDKIDNYFLKNIGYIKIDIEGNESYFIEGASEFIEKNRPVIQIEIEQRHNDDPISDIFEKIIAFSYEGFFFRAEKAFLLNKFSIRDDQELILSGNKKGKYVNNFIFIPSEKSDLLKKAQSFQ